MQYLNRFNPIKLRTAVRHLEQALTRSSETALKRKETLDLWDKHGYSRSGIGNLE